MVMDNIGVMDKVVSLNLGTFEEEMVILEVVVVLTGTQTSLNASYMVKLIIWCLAVGIDLISFQGPSFNQSGFSEQTSSNSMAMANFTATDPMIAKLTTPKMNYDPNWNPDSSATNHVTPDLTNLMTPITFSGSDKIRMGNGIGLSIQHIGSSNFPSQFHTKMLSLNDLLHVPLITKNLISVSKFAKDNKVFFEFHPTICFVKD
ncbi:hypothetical protein PanWU01x14_092200 [Parasponia andersonii]|uniref:Retrovirus-related Pol polyprotein from transposon TNT 1-94-like beta-barrel domain-containing protein n=1 Tax=Parasponia andersonii TaxID=3476 RepID=A0A2P5D6H0_PARAD|nr:hypothetical protein PanWU01x14_092200 [Parasponia andersonii]